MTEIEDLKNQIATRDKAILELKDKTKTYIKKLQLDHSEALQHEKELAKQAQDKVDAAKQFFNKMRDEEGRLKAEVKRLQSLVDEHKSSESLNGHKHHADDVSLLRESLNQETLRAQALQEQNTQLTNRLTLLESQLQLQPQHISSSDTYENTNTSPSDRNHSTLSTLTETTPSSQPCALLLSGEDTLTLKSLQHELQLSKSVEERLKSQLQREREQFEHLLNTSISDPEKLTSLHAQLLQLQGTSMKDLQQNNLLSSCHPAEAPGSEIQTTQQNIAGQQSSEDRSSLSILQDQLSQTQTELQSIKNNTAVLTSQYEQQIQSLKSKSEGLSRENNLLRNAQESRDTGEIERSKSIKDEINRLKDQLHTTKTSLSEKLSAAETLVNNLQTDLKLKTSESQKLEAALVNAKHEYDNQSWGLKKEIEIQKSKVLKFETEQKPLITRCETAERQLTEKNRNNEELKELLRSKEQVILSLQSDEEERQKIHKLQLTQTTTAAKQRVAELLTDLDTMKDMLTKKEKERDDMQSNMSATGSANSALQAQNEVLRGDVERLTAQLHNALADMQERKKKVRAYVDTITTEKKALEEQVVTITGQLQPLETEMISLRSQVSTLESKISTLKEELSLSQDCHVTEMKQLEIKLRNQLDEKESERERLQQVIEEFSKTSGNEVKEAQSRVDLARQEAEEHKTKRLAARQEMINLSEALEQTQTDLLALQTFFQSSLMPLVYEQVSHLETILVNVEGAADQLSSKGSVQMQNRARGFLENQFRRKRPNNDDSGTGLDISMRDTTTSQSGDENPMDLTLSPHTTNKIIRKGMTEAMETAEGLKSELDRVRAGLVLLSLSVDRLTDLVIVDSKCCGGLYSFFVSSEPTRKGYSSVSSIDQSDHATQHGLSVLSSKNGRELSSHMPSSSTIMR